MKPHWWQRLGNAIAIVTLLVAAVAIWLLQSRKEPATVQDPNSPRRTATSDSGNAAASTPGSTSGAAPPSH